MTFSHAWPFWKNTVGIRVYSRALLGKIQPEAELSTTQPSSYHVPARTSGCLPTQAETSSSALSRQTVCWDI